VQNKTFITNKTLNLGGRLLDLSQPRVMGILNSTPDSFYSGSRVANEKDVLERAGQMLADGAALLDVGGYSTRPGANNVSEEEERQRVIPVIRSLLREFPHASISIDTFRSSVAVAAVEAGAVMINDVSGGTHDASMFQAVARLKVPYVLMHMQGTPQTMASLTNYNNLVKDVMDYFHTRMADLLALGATDIVLDPGFGFAKTTEQNFTLLQHLSCFKMAGKPLLVGLSRKSMVWKTLQANAEQSLNGTTALNTAALLNGADMVRVHDVKEAAEVVKLVMALRQHV
jgi:dihydropteroate synthase